MPERQGSESTSTVASLEINGKGDGLGGCNNSCQRYSSPIRISQASQHVARPAAHRIPLPEHNLRRKTPNGTVEAGYDGSHIQSSAGPPLKQLILSAPFNLKMISCPNSMPLSLQHCNYWNHSMLPIPFDQAIQTQVSSLPYLWTPHDGPSTFNWMGNSIQHFMVERPDLKQPVVRANDHNVRAFCPPPPPNSGSLVPGQPACHSGVTNGNYRNHDQTRYSGPGCSPNDSQWPSRFCQGSNVMPPAQIMMMSGQPGFREKVLESAYHSYVGLLSYLQANGKTNPTRTSPSTLDTQKLPAYPRPPRLWGNGTIAGINFTGSHSRPNNAVATATLCTRRDAVESSRSTYNEMYHDKTDGRGVNIAHKPVRTDFDTTMSFSSYNASRKPSPIVNAMSSLKILASLCGQSDWKWVEGMLVGGCLQYGLELYNEALESFSRIVAINPSHVEAITHMGAALYCLGCKDEAEQNWLRVVKLRPSYLDATEHLVGHIYQHRGQETVEVISYVQSSLYRATQVSALNEEMRSIPDSSNGAYSPLSNDPITGSSTPVEEDEDKCTGFGSSGYLLPGGDNGRLLALVHTKGTILYARKDTERASEAFQEAVMISVGRQVSSIQELIYRIQLALSPQAECQRQARTKIARSLQPLMLPPERARQTARLLFGSNGELPGLIHLRKGLSKRVAVQITSNSLLSLAKILQDAISSGSADSCLLHGASQVSDILTLYYLSFSLQESPSTANNVGILLAGFPQIVTTTPVGASSRISPQPGVPGIIPGSGHALALAYYNYGLRLDPNHVHLHTNLGSLLKDIGQLDLAIQMYERAVLCDGSFDIALTNLANAVKDKGRINEAIVYYQRAVNANPRFAEAVCGLFTALNSVCNWHGRGGALLESGLYDRWHVGDDGRLVDIRISGCGSGLTKRVIDIVVQQLRDASHWGLGILQEPVIHGLTRQLHHLCKNPSFKLDAALRRWAGQPWEGSRLVRLIERAMRIIQRNWYIDAHQTAGQGEKRYLRPSLPQNLAVPSAPTVLPFHTFTCPLSAFEIRTIAQRNAIRISFSTLRSPWITTTVNPPPPPPNPQLNVGYLSSDFNNHPLAHLMQSTFGFHNPHRVKAICYATTPSDGSIHRQQIEKESPIFRDVSNWSPAKLINQINQDNVHILVNLNGYTRGARNEIFAARPAPIQMSFMGFAGTLGAEWCDYLLADRMAIPRSTLRPWRNNVSIEDIFRDNNEESDGDWMYSENIIFCRETFFCCDHAQSCVSGEMSHPNWAEVERQRWEMRKELFPDLGDNVVILGNFNQLYKIDPTTFRSWLRILSRVPRAVLWLLRFPEPGESNLRATARQWAGPEVASRIVFTDVAPKSQHISRARVCDLFLDTPECNAHTTAADILWSSTPLLTFPRYPYKMCSRMAASILQGALPNSSEGQRVAAELITHTEEEYEQRATELANDLTHALSADGYGQSKGRLADMRKLLWDSKRHCSLFDTRRWVEHLERAYEKAWERWVRGLGGDIYL
ncbi:hypothetical protein E4U55_003913 [Claviceps digitariae]|nr:hypothetical protein E4U55_003913 [Claviceps digitariae]